jgi:putative transposase
LSICRQCELLGLARSSFYYEPAVETAENLTLMRLIDRRFTDCPFYGSRKMTIWLQGEGHKVNRKRVQRLLRLMGLEAVYPRPKLSAPGQGHKVFPYLLRGVTISRVSQVWSTDITYVPLASGFLYLAAVIDWFSRYVIAWRLSNTLDGSFCLELLDEALTQGRPEVFNTDQGVQFTAEAFTGRLEAAGVKVSMDGKGRCLDNVFVERLWRTVKTVTTKTTCLHTRYRDRYNRSDQRLSVGTVRIGQLVPRPAASNRRIRNMSRHQSDTIPPRP